MKSRSSCYITKYYDIVSPKFENSIFMDYYDGGSINSLIESTARYMSNKTKFEIMHKIIQGLRFLRDCNIIHMDMKFENILLAKDLGIKIADFGEAH